MTATINCRALVKGASWANPAVLVYAASATENLSYWLDGSWASSYNDRTSAYSGCQNTVRISNSNAYGNFSAGYRDGHDDGASPDITVHLT